jgi:hypothetical protein
MGQRGSSFKKSYDNPEEAAMAGRTHCSYGHAVVDCKGRRETRPIVFWPGRNPWVAFNDSTKQLAYRKATSKEVDSVRKWFNVHG